MRNYAYYKMQLLILIKYGRMPVNQGIAQFFLEDNLVSQYRKQIREKEKAESEI